MKRITNKISLIYYDIGTFVPYYDNPEHDDYDAWHENQDKNVKLVNRVVADLKKEIKKRPAGGNTGEIF
jgi:hypothetical protein